MLMLAERSRLVASLSPSAHRSGILRPSFGWNLAQSFADSGQNLPECVKEPTVVRAHSWLLHGKPDLSISLAYMLNLPSTQPQRDLLRALLVCHDITIPKLPSTANSRLGLSRPSKSCFGRRSAGRRIVITWRKCAGSFAFGIVWGDGGAT